MTRKLEVDQAIMDLADSAGPLSRVLAHMYTESRETCQLDERSYTLVRFAALVSLGAAPMSYLTTFAIGEEAGVTIDEIRDVLIAIAPVVGSARVVAALASTDGAW